MSPSNYFPYGIFPKLPREKSILLVKFLARVSGPIISRADVMTERKEIKTIILKFIRLKVVNFYFIVIYYVKKFKFSYIFIIIY